MPSNVARAQIPAFLAPGAAAESGRRAVLRRGVHSVGIDRVIERADVARASLYSTFGSKDELIRAYLENRMEISKARLRAAAEAQADPRERLLSVFGVQAAVFARPGYHGCPFNRATAEAQPGSAAYEVPRAYRGWLRDFLRELAAAAGGARSGCCSPARSTCSTTARCRPRAWTATPGSPRPPGRRPRPCWTRPWPAGAAVGTGRSPSPPAEVRASCHGPRRLHPTRQLSHGTRPGRHQFPPQSCGFCEVSSPGEVSSSDGVSSSMRGTGSRPIFSAILLSSTSWAAR